MTPPSPSGPLSGPPSASSSVRPPSSVRLGLTFTALSMLVVGSVACAGSAASRGRALEQTDPPAKPQGSLTVLEPSQEYLAVPRTVPPAASASDKWWESASPCPAGSELSGSPPPGDQAVRCRTPQKKNEGRGTTFHEDGRKKSEGGYSNAFANGVWTEWDANGNVSRIAPFEAGKEQGLVTEYHPDGKIAAQREYRAGVREGVSTLWDESGNKRLEQPYRAGKKHGIATQWTSDGRVFKVELWENDQLLQTEQP